jgi:hypothetical protein
LIRDWEARPRRDPKVASGQLWRELCQYDEENDADADYDHL